MATSSWRTVHRGKPDHERLQCGLQGWISTSFLSLSIRTSWLSHPGQPALCLSFPSVKGSCSYAWKGCAECLPTGLEGSIHTFCQAKAGQLRCHHHQSRNRFTSYSLGVFETAWAAGVLQGCTSCCVQRCHQLRLSNKGGRICHAQGWLSSQCCCMTITPQCLSFPTWAVRLLKPCGLRGPSGEMSRETTVPTGTPTCLLPWEWPQSSPELHPLMPSLLVAEDGWLVWPGRQLPGAQQPPAAPRGQPEAPAVHGGGQ